MRNVVTLTGRVGKAPIIRTMGNGDKLATFSVATAERWRDRQSGERQERTTWHQVTVFNKGLVKVIEGGNLRSGQFIQLVGTLVYDQYEKDGVTLTSAKVVLKSPSHFIDFLDIPRPKDEDMAEEPAEQPKPARAASKKKTQAPAPDTFDLDDEIPF